MVTISLDLNVLSIIGWTLLGVFFLLVFLGIAKFRGSRSYKILVGLLGVIAGALLYTGYEVGVEFYPSALAFWLIVLILLASALILTRGLLGDDRSRGGAYESDGSTKGKV